MLLALAPTERDITDRTKTSSDVSVTGDVTDQKQTTAGLPMSYKLGSRWDSAIAWSDFKSEAIFGFLSPNYTWRST